MKAGLRNISVALAVALVVLAATPFPKVYAAPGVVRGSRITVFVGSDVKVYVKLTASSPSSGTLRVEVRKDVVWAADVLYATLTQQVTLTAGENTVYAGSFTADVLTSDSVGSVRQYFVKIYWNDVCIYDPTDPNTRECVFTKPKTVAGGGIGYGGTVFEGEG